MNTPESATPGRPWTNLSMAAAALLVGAAAGLLLFFLLRRGPFGARLGDLRALAAGRKGYAA